MMRLRENSESVAFYDGEAREAGVLKKRFNLLLNNFWQIINKQKQLIWLNSGYSQIAIIFPFVVCMPRYLSKQISLGGLMQIAAAFGRVQDALSYFIDMYASMAEWKSVVDRLVGFGLHMREAKSSEEHSLVKRGETSGSELVVEQMQIDLPDGEILLKNLNFVFAAGRNVLVKGKSGSGKSTLLRSLAGIWPYASGTLQVPIKSKIMFVPQKPYLPLGTLREALLYPGTAQKSDEELRALLMNCNIGYLSDKLDVEADWSHVLSIGEQQRLAFARVLIYAPEWLFLDEATSALDEEAEEKMYSLLKEKLIGTTVISIGHRSTLHKYHIDELLVDRNLASAFLKQSY